MTAQLKAFRHDGLTFQYSDAGPADGPAVVLLHGFPQNHRCWDDIAPRLHDVGYRTLAPDLRGYSPEANPSDPAAYRLSVQVNDILALAEAAGADQFHLVGHDWGGALGWGGAGGGGPPPQPARVQTFTSLSTPHPGALSAAIRHSDQAARSAYMLMFQVPRISERIMLRSAKNLSAQMGPQASAKYLDRLHTPADWRGPLNWYRGNSPYARQPIVGRCPVNTTYIWGSRDPYLGRHAAQHTGGWVNGDYEFVELDAGHWLPEKQADACAQAILRRLASGL